MGYDELRRYDYSLEEHQVALVKAFGDLFEKECPPAVVRASEGSGFAPDLWKRANHMGLTSMSIPASFGGDDSSLLDVALVAEHAGAVLAPVPLVSHVVACRALAWAGAPREVIDAALTGERIVTLALAPVTPAAKQLVPEAAIAGDVLAYEAGEFILHSGSPRKSVPNHAGSAVGWWSPSSSDHRLVLASGADADDLFRRACDEWKILMAASLVGLADRALSIGVEFSKTRKTMRVPIGSLQGVSFPLADGAIGVEGARNLVSRSAWMLENAPDDQPELPRIAFSYAREVAADVVATSVHVQGGLGVSLEADITMYFNRATAWPAPAGRISEDFAEIAAAFASRIR